jgi:hypothetical protein
MSETINEQLQQRWHPFVRTGFRFAFVYLLLYNLPFPLTAIPCVDKCEQASPEVITLAGLLNGSELTARLRRSEERKFVLTDRGFHWINEFPFNR